MNKINKISQIIAKEVLKKYKLQLDKNIVVGRIEALLNKEPKLQNIISANLDTITIKEAKAILSILEIELNRVDKTWQQRFRKEIVIYRLSENKNRFKTIVLLSFFFLVLKPKIRLLKSRKRSLTVKNK